MSTPARHRRAGRGDGDGDALLARANVTKVFGGLVAVEDVTFEIPERWIVSIIGPNGAGKTTFFNMLTGPLQAELRADLVRRAATSPAGGRTGS